MSRFTEETRRRLHQQQLERVGNPKLAGVIERNIATIAQMRQKAEEQRSLQDRIADYFTWVSGSTPFVYAHAVWFGVWMVANLGWLGIEPFDPFPFGLLTLIVSLEAIFLSTFVLLTQNRQAAVADQRADLDLQINLLAEHEITRLLVLVDRIAKRLNVSECEDPELPELERDVLPESLLEKLGTDSNNKNRNRKPR